MTNINVLVVATNFPDKYYPYLAPWSKMQADSLFKAGVNIEVIAPRPYTIPFNIFPYSNFYRLPIKEIVDAGYTIHYPRFLYLTPKSIFFGLTGDIYSKMIGKYILEKINIDKIDIIHSRFTYLDGYGTLNVCKKFEIPLVVDVHGAGAFGDFLDRLTIRKKQKKTLDFADKILCVAKWQIDAGIQRGIPEDKLQCVPLGVDMELFKKGDTDLIKKELFIQNDTKIVLYVGQLIPRKGLNYLIESIPNILNKHKNIIFIIIGTGSHKKYLINLCLQKNIQKSVQFLGGIDISQLIKWYSIADIFVLPSLKEGRPIVIYEAMSCELPIIATDAGGVSEQVENGYNGFVVKPGDSKALADNIAYLLENEDLRKNMCRNSRKRIIEQGWTWNDYAQRVIKIYESLV